MPSGPAPGVAEADVGERREPGADHAAQHLVGGGMVVVLRADRRSEVVRRAAATEEDPPVRRSRQVVDARAEGMDALAVGPADGRPLRVGQRLGQDDQRVERDELAVERLEPRQPGLAGEDDGPSARRRRARCAGRARRRSTPRAASAGVPGREAGHARSLVDGRAATLDRARQPADELGRLDRRVVGA